MTTMLLRSHADVTAVGKWTHAVLSESLPQQRPPRHGQYPPFHQNHTELNSFPDTYALIMSVLTERYPVVNL